MVSDSGLYLEPGLLASTAQGFTLLIMGSFRDSTEERLGWGRRGRGRGQGSQDPWGGRRGGWGQGQGSQDLSDHSTTCRMFKASTSHNVSHTSPLTKEWC